MEELLKRLEKLCNLEKSQFKIPYKGHMIDKKDSEILRQIDNKIKNNYSAEKLKEERDELIKVISIIKRILRDNPFMFINLNNKDYNRIMRAIDKYER